MIQNRQNNIARVQVRRELVSLQEEGVLVSVITKIFRVFKQRFLRSSRIVRSRLIYMRKIQCDRSRNANRALREMINRVSME